MSSAVRPPSLPYSDDDEDDAIYDDKPAKPFDSNTINQTRQSQRTSAKNDYIKDEDSFFDDKPPNHKSLDINANSFNASRKNPNDGKNTAAEDTKSRYSYDDDFSDFSDPGQEASQAQPSYSHNSDSASLNNRKQCGHGNDKENRSDSHLNGDYSAPKSPDNNLGKQDDSYNEDQYSDEFHSDFETDNLSDPRHTPTVGTDKAQNPVMSAKRQPTLSVTDNYKNRPVSSTYDPYRVKGQEQHVDDSRYDLDKLSPLAASNNRINSTVSMARLRNNKGRVSKVSRRSPLVNNSLGGRNHTNLSLASKRYGPTRKKVKSVQNGATSVAENRLDANELRHEVMVIGEEIESLKMENKVLKRNNILVSHQIIKREKEESDLPFVYERQSKEIKVLKDQLRRQEERYDKTHHRLRQVERELRRSEKEEKRLEERARDNDLEERDKLKQRLDRLNQQNAIADEKIAQLEKYAENLQKCHDRQLATEQQKRYETEALIDDLHEGLRYAKQSIRAKENDLEKFNIQHSYRHAARSRMNSSMSQQLALSEPPPSRVMTSDTDNPPNYRRDQVAVYPRSANQRKVQQPAQLRALPAPPIDKPRELKQRKPSVIHEESNTPRKPEQSTNKKPNNISLERQRDKKQNEQMLAPSPPAAGRPAQRNTRHRTSSQEQPKPNIDKPVHKQSNQTDERSTGHLSNKPNDQALENLKKTLDDEKRRSELLRTNMALSQSMSRKQSMQELIKQQETPVPGSTSLMEREDSWAGILKVQEKITETVGGNRRPDLGGSVISLGASPREQTFAVIKPRGPAAPKRIGTELDQQEKAALLNALHGSAAAENGLNLAQPSTAKHQNNNNNDILTNSRDKTFLSVKSSLGHFGNTAETDLFPSKNPSSPKPVNNSLDFGGYQPSSFNDNQITQKPSRRRDTSLQPNNSNIIFGDDLDELNL